MTAVTIPETVLAYFAPGDAGTTQAAVDTVLAMHHPPSAQSWADIRRFFTAQMIGRKTQYDYCIALFDIFDATWEAALAAVGLASAPPTHAPPERGLFTQDAIFAEALYKPATVHGTTHTLSVWMDGDGQIHLGIDAPVEAEDWIWDGAETTVHRTGVYAGSATAAAPRVDLTAARRAVDRLLQAL